MTRRTFTVELSGWIQISPLLSSFTSDFLFEFPLTQYALFGFCGLLSPSPRPAPLYSYTQPRLENHRFGQRLRLLRSYLRGLASGCYYCSQIRALVYLPHYLVPQLPAVWTAERTYCVIERTYPQVPAFTVLSLQPLHPSKSIGSEMEQDPMGPSQDRNPLPPNHVPCLPFVYRKTLAKE